MLEATEYTLPGLKEDGGLINALVRYRLPPDSDDAAHSGGVRVRLSLLLLHAVASHKESWLPTLEHLFKIQHATPTNAFAVVEAWSIEAPNHGRAAVLNDKHIPSLKRGVPGAQWARVCQQFFNSGLIEPGTLVVGIGHSAGAGVIVQSTLGYPLDRLPLASMIMVEPPMMTEEGVRKATEAGAILILAVDIARMRKDIWPSRAAAREWFAKRVPWKRWDPRVLDLFIEYGLVDLPTSTYPDLKEGVTLATPRSQESAGYSHHADAYIGLERLKELCPAMPVHCIFGEINNMVPEETQAEIADPKSGRQMRSIVRVAGAGHLVVQDDPRGLALALWGILHEDFARPMPHL